MSQTTRWYPATTILLAGLICWLAANAPAAETESRTRINILAIHATKEEKPHIDPELEPLKEALSRSGYNSFRLVAKERRSVGTAETWEQPMLEDYALRVTPTVIAEDRVTLTYAWVHYEKDEQGRRIARVLQQVPMTLIKGKYFVSGGWRLKKGALVGAFAAE